MSLFDADSYWSDLPVSRLPLEPVLRAWGSDVGGLASAANVHRRTVQRWLEEGVTFNLADELAVLVGRHPIELWGGLWLEATQHEESWPTTTNK